MPATAMPVMLFCRSFIVTCFYSRSIRGHGPLLRVVVHSSSLPTQSRHTMLVIFSPPEALMFPEMAIGQNVEGGTPCAVLQFAGSH
jgi:hypothetical protein